MRVDWCVSSWFRIKNTHSLTDSEAARTRSIVARKRSSPPAGLKTLSRARRRRTAAGALASADG